MKKQATTIVENIKKEGQKFIAIIEPTEIEDEIISEAVIPSNIDVGVGDTVIIEKKQGRFVIKEVLLDLREEEETEEEETEPVVLEEIEKEPPTHYEVQERGMAEESKAKKGFKKFLKGFGLGGLYVGGGILFILFNILQFLVSAIVGLLMIWWAIVEFLEGSIIVGLLVLLIGTPIAIGIAHWAFIFLFFLAILSAILWGIANLFGLSVSFGNAWDIVWLVIKILLLGGMAFLGISGFIGAIKEKRVAEFFKENWFYILLFFFLLWLFF